MKQRLADIGLPQLRYTQALDEKLANSARVQRFVDTAKDAISNTTFRD